MVDVWLPHLSAWGSFDRALTREPLYDRQTWNSPVKEFSLFKGVNWQTTQLPSSICARLRNLSTSSMSSCNYVILIALAISMVIILLSLSSHWIKNGVIVVAAIHLDTAQFHSEQLYNHHHQDQNILLHSYSHSSGLHSFLTLKRLGHFFQNVILISNVVQH